MALTAGTRLGHYNVTALIGEGGMGQVWQATDTQLNRQVALKILPDAFADDPDRLARFQREAQVLASLNHPGIAAIHGIEKSGDSQALVLELVEGPTLADRIATGPISLDEALPIAKQIAEALEAAHEQGVIHRDLKPANIKVREDGTVKVLDFGLAKALGSPGGDPFDSPTATAAATATGVIIGTAAYMSPEQARGKPVDKRADIWAFGAVLYEMLTGQRPFAGRDVSETLAAVIQSNPDWDALPGDAPPYLNALLRRCLEKDPRERLRDIGDVRLAMAGAFETTVSAAEPAVAPRPRVWQRPVPLAIALATAMLAAGGTVWTLVRPEAFSAGLMRFVIVLPDTAPIASQDAAPALAISRDGSQIVYTSVGPSGPQLYLRSIDQLDGAPLPARGRSTDA
jgi:serine/threonine-protein kinase